MALDPNITFSNLGALNDKFTEVEQGGGSVGPTGPQGPQGPQGETGATGSFNSNIIKIQSGFILRNTALQIFTEAPHDQIYSLGLGANGLTFSGISSISMNISFIFDDFSFGSYQGKYSFWFRFGTGTPPDNSVIVSSLTASYSMFGSEEEYETDILPDTLVSLQDAATWIDLPMKHSIIGARQNLDPNQVYWFDLFISEDFGGGSAAAAQIDFKNIQVNTIAY